MARFLIYVPDSICADPSGLNRLDSVGLSRLKAGAIFQTLELGPDAGSGILASWPRKGEPRGDFLPSQQTWMPAVKVGDLLASRYWVGFQTGNLPSPKDLAWRNQAPGQYLTLGKVGHQWLFPSASSLPVAFSEATDGSIGLPPQELTREFCDVGQQTYAKMIGGSLDDIDVSAVVALVLRGLQVNYMILPEVVSYLKLIDTRNLRDLVVAGLGGLHLATATSLAQEIEQSMMPEIPSELMD